MRYYLETFGCQANGLDSSYLEGLLRREGFEAAASPQEADWVLLNTCAVRRHAEGKVFSRLGILSGLRDKHPRMRIAVLGCMAVSYQGGILKRFPKVDLVAGPDQYARVPAALASPPSPGGIVRTGFDPGAFPENLPAEGAAPFKAFVAIMKGCNNHCSYCVVPRVRGPEVSRPHADVLEEVRRLAEQGVREVVLLGQNVNSYDSGGIGFPALLRTAASIAGLERVRFYTSHPKDLSDELIEVMASTPTVCEFIHLPVQSGSDGVLKRMNRRYTAGYYRQLVEKLRAFVKDIAITTDLIVGFPGETEEEFKATLALLEEVRFDSVFSFKYSPRPGTDAICMGDGVPEGVLEDRLARLNAAAWAHAKERHHSRIGRTEEVLVEGPADRTPGAWWGKTRQNKTAVFGASAGRTLSPGELVPVKMESNRIACLYGTAE